MPGSPPNSAALLRRVSGFSVTRCARAAQRRRRLVEADVAVGANAEDLQVDSARVGNLLLVARAFGFGIGGSAVEEMDPLRIDVDVA